MLETTGISLPCAAKAVYPVVSGVVQKRPIPHRCNPQPTKKTKTKTAFHKHSSPPDSQQGEGSRQETVLLRQTTIIKYEKKKKKKTKEEKCGKMDGDRGVHIPHSANKQKVNSSEGNTLTPDASHDPPPAHSGFP